MSTNATLHIHLSMRLEVFIAVKLHAVVFQNYDTVL